MNKRFKKITITKDRVSDRIIQAIEQAVQDGTLAQGEKLPTEEKLAAQFQVSKVAVREALREMEVRGLIRKQRGMYGGNFVSAPDVNRIGASLISCYQFGTLTEEEMIDFRQTLEPMLIRKACELRTPEDLAAMADNIKRCEDDLARGETRAFRHIEFHILIAKSTGNRLFVAVMEAMAQIFDVIARPWQDNRERMRQDIEFNHKFYHCILNQEAERAESLMRAHFDLTRAFRQEDQEQLGAEGPTQEKG